MTIISGLITARLVSVVQGCVVNSILGDNHFSICTSVKVLSQMPGAKVNVKEALYFIYPSFYLSSKGHVDPRKAPRVYFHLEGWRVEDHEGSS